MMPLLRWLWNLCADIGDCLRALMDYEEAE